MFFFKTTLAQNYSILTGTVVEKNTGLPVIGASVYIDSIKKGGVTDTAGNYVITNIPRGIYNLEISSMSYNSVKIKDLRVNAPYVKFDIIMEEASNILNQIVVTSAKRMSSEIAIIQSIKSADVVMSGI